MHILKYLLCLSVIISSLFISQASEQTYSTQDLIQQNADKDMAELTYIIKHSETNSPDKLLYVESLIFLHKDRIDDLIAPNNQDFRINPLGLAVMLGKTAIVKLFLKHGARVTDIAHHDALIPRTNALWLCPADNIKIFKDLLAADPNVEHTINSPNIYGKTLLHDILLSIEESAPIDDIKQKLCWAMSYGANPKAQTRDGNTAYDIASSFPKAHRQDILGILHKDRTSSFTPFLREHMLAIKGNTATYVRNRHITGPWKGAQKITKRIKATREKRPADDMAEEDIVLQPLSKKQKSS